MEIFKMPFRTGEQFHSSSSAPAVIQHRPFGYGRSSPHDPPLLSPWAWLPVRSICVAEPSLKPIPGVSSYNTVQSLSFWSFLANLKLYSWILCTGGIIKLLLLQRMVVSVSFFLSTKVKASAPSFISRGLITVFQQPCLLEGDLSASGRRWGNRTNSAALTAQGSLVKGFEGGIFPVGLFIFI